MPFMFEREGDYTELLIPANLLADDSVLNRAVRVLTVDVCKDVEVIGWLYQFYISERKTRSSPGSRRTRRQAPTRSPLPPSSSPRTGSCATWSRTRSAGSGCSTDPSSGLASQMDYYIEPVDEETDFLKISKPEELKVIDPACGSGHMLTYAFDLLYAIYEEEGYGPAEIPGLILTTTSTAPRSTRVRGRLPRSHLTMKARAKQRTFFNKQVEPGICVLAPIAFSPNELDFLLTKGGDKHAEVTFWNQFAEADTLGSLIEPDPDITARLARHVDELDDRGDILHADVLEWAHRAITQAKYLAEKYAVVVANPPYMGSANMGSTLASFMQDVFPSGKADIYAGFILRSRSLQADLGITAMVVGDSWLFIKSFETMRKWILDNYSLSSLLHLQDSSKHSDIFGANAAFVLSGRDMQRSDPSRTTFLHLNAQGSEAKDRILRRAISGHETTNVYVVDSAEFRKLPLTSYAYSLPAHLCDLFNASRVKSIAHVHRGISTGNNERYMRFWFEVSRETIKFGARSAADTSDLRWYPVNRGSFPAKWYGYGPEILDYRAGGSAMIAASRAGSNPGFRHDGSSEYFKETITWSAMAAARPEFRLLPAGFVLGHKGAGIGVSDDSRRWLLGLLNSAPATEILRRISGTIDVLVGQIQELPIPPTSDRERIVELVSWLVEHQRRLFAQSEEVAEFERHPLVAHWDGRQSLREATADWHRRQIALAHQAQEAEQEIDLLFSKAYDLPPTGDRDVSVPTTDGLVAGLVSFAVGCMLGRFSLDAPGFVLSDQGATFADYIAKVPSARFAPDFDNVLPIVDGDWFEDDIVEQFRRFLREAFGAQHFEENLRFINESLKVKHLRDYFLTKAGRSRFYDDHVVRYKKRPIYWLFSSPKGSFNALIYMHRYTPSTASTVLNEYLREFQAKLMASLEHAERSNNARESDRLRTILLELDQYEHDVLYPLASQNIAIDLDEGVKANYPKFGVALKKIAGLEATE
jgi:hypothetical protein